MASPMLTNMTPHPVNFYRAGDVYRKGNKLWLIDPSVSPYFILDTPIPPSPVRVTSSLVPYGYAEDGVPLFEDIVAGITNCPEPAEGVLYVVSRPAAEFLWSMGRTDIACPLDSVHITETRVAGCTGLRLRRITHG